ncbi:putative NBD/HSP70 family sugar kinase [Leucobacter komagatae]|uniref:Putative NBD/HSP70 family sugar kinase n=1 Tax=Leucobacter komagatae TaxID=55969 RepID=A0A542Y8R5_9MICO|nr:ROK family transcriptional regulator [Leucobacter komagatae]TQL44478.1 putative NBD/HSP70 family sugar kinase [Leucobacter komagatae]
MKHVTTRPADATAWAINPRRARDLRVAAKATPGDTKLHNRTLVLQTMYISGPLSRADIARATQLTKVTVSGIVAELIGEGIIEELGQRESNRPGKPAILVDLARSAHAIVALDLSDEKLLRGAVVDLAGRTLARAEAPRLDDAGNAVTGDAACDLVSELAVALRDASEIPLLGLGVGTPGVVDDEGVVRVAPNLGWEGLPLKRILTARTGLPTSIGNDANVAALAEYSFGDTSEDFALVRIGYGVGAGIILGGRSVPGSKFASGEIGQVMVGTDLGIDAPYAREQVLEHWLSVPTLTRALDEAGPAGREAVLREAGNRLGITLAPIIGMLNLAEIVLAGPPELVDGTLTEAAFEILTRRTMPDSHDTLVFRPTSQGDDLILRGAAAIVLRERLGVS